MAEINKTKHYGLTIFDKTQTTLTFADFRKLLAGTAENEDDRSNMELIDDYLNQLKIDIDSNFNASKKYSEDVVLKLEQDLKEIVKNNGEKIIIGSDNGLPVEINDGIGISSFADGMFNTEKITVNESRFGDYLLRRNMSNEHFQILYKPTGGGN